jgi:RraA family protein
MEANMRQNPGFRIFVNVQRPARELVEQYRGIPTSNINDNMNRLFCMRHEIKPLNNHALLGTAVTVKAPIGDNAILHMALDIAQPGDIIVVDGAGALDRSLMGEIMVVYAVGRGIAGFVVDGAVRDLDGLRNAAIPIYAAGVASQGPYKNGPGEINVPIACGSQVVFPGDIIAGDQDGIVVIRPEYAEELAELSREKLEKENAQLAAMRSGNINEEKHKDRYSKIVHAKGVRIIE